MNCPRCDSPAETQALRQFGGVCAKCLLDFAAEKDAPAFPHLEIVSTLGEGGMGVVYKAVQKQLGRTVALKVLSPQLSTDPSFVERFTREAKALASLSHPNIVSIHEAGVHDGVPYLVMEYVDGLPLRKLIRSGKLTAERALEIVPQICDALAYAHSRGVVHRDVKPENILIGREGRVKIADFGLAKLASSDPARITRTHAVMGTPNYMAPEQIENPGAVDHRADLYSLGVVFYEMLTGELPLGRFKAPSERAPVDPQFDPVVLRSLEKAPADRWQSASEVRDQVSGIQPARRAPGSAQGPRVTVREGSVPTLLLLAILALLLGEVLHANHRHFAASLCGKVGFALALATLVLSILEAIETIRNGRGVRALGAKAGPLAASATLLGLVVLVATGTIRLTAYARTEAVPRRLHETRPFHLDDVWQAGHDSLPGHLCPGTHLSPPAPDPLPFFPEVFRREVVRHRWVSRGPEGPDLLGLQFRDEAAKAAAFSSAAVEPLLHGWDARLSGGPTVLLISRGEGERFEALWTFLKARCEAAAGDQPRNR